MKREVVDDTPVTPVTTSGSPITERTAVGLRHRVSETITKIVVTVCTNDCVLGILFLFYLVCKTY